MGYIIWGIVLATIVYITYTTRKRIAPGQQDLARFEGGEKYVIWVTALANPVLSGLIYYYGLKNKAPNKARQANYATFVAFVPWIIYFVYVVSQTSATS